MRARRSSTPLRMTCSTWRPLLLLYTACLDAPTLFRVIAPLEVAALISLSMSACLRTFLSILSIVESAMASTRTLTTRSSLCLRTPQIPFKT
ncbi:hypothetical protein Pelo_18533 [Pelomyxa schiedti]|nr:hypothetical protein Pelo_18533 [Pelomyxa schiedti]